MASLIQSLQTRAMRFDAALSFCASLILLSRRLVLLPPLQLILLLLWLTRLLLLLAQAVSCLLPRLTYSSKTRLLLLSQLLRLVLCARNLLTSVFATTFNFKVTVHTSFCTPFSTDDQ